MSLTKNDKYIIKNLIDDYEILPELSAVDLTFKYHISKSALYGTLAKCGMSSYVKLQNRIRFYKEIECKNMIIILHEMYECIKDFLNQNNDIQSLKTLYMYLYDTYCDIESLTENELKSILFAWLEKILLRFDDYFQSKLKFFDIVNEIKTVYDLIGIE